MNKKNYRWVPRSKEWIKENPGKGTMYKEYFEPQKEEGNSEDFFSINTPITPKSVKLYPNPKKTMGSGIYIVICEVEKHVYVGQSRNVENRLRNHKMVISSNDEHESKAYIKMKAHRKLHGLNAFEFIKYDMIPHATTSMLLDREAEVMAEFARKGYLLYNRSIALQVMDESIYCPIQFQPFVANLVNLLTTHPDKGSKVIDFVKQLII